MGTTGIGDFVRHGNDVLRREAVLGRILLAFERRPNKSGELPCATAGVMLSRVTVWAVLRAPRYYSRQMP